MYICIQTHIISGSQVCERERSDLMVWLWSQTNAEQIDGRPRGLLQCFAVWCCCLPQFVADCCIVSQCVSVSHVLNFSTVFHVCCKVLQHVAVRCIVWSSILVCRSVLQCIVLCCIMLQCFVVFCIAMQFWSVWGRQWRYIIYINDLYVSINIYLSIYIHLYMYIYIYIDSDIPQVSNESCIHYALTYLRAWNYVCLNTYIHIHIDMYDSDIPQVSKETCIHYVTLMTLHIWLHLISKLKRVTRFGHTCDIYI